MESYTFEPIQELKDEKAKIFVAYIGKSKFHWHYEYELILVLKGSVNLKYRPNSVLLERGDIVMLNSKSVHELEKTNEENLCLFVQISETMFKDLNDKNKKYEFYLNSKNEIIPPKKEYNNFIKLLAKLGLECFNSGLVTHFRKKALLFQLVADLFEFVPYDIIQNSINNDELKDVDMLMNIIQFIQDNHKKNDVLDALYKTMGMSEKTVYRFLKNNVGLSQKDLVMISRIEEAKEMLINGDKSIQYIAFECGFCAENTFYRAFKKIVGVTPKEYRVNGIKHGKKSEVNGYLGFNENEAKKLLGDLIKER
ncbi:MAG: AraC family transcriptional regulator [Clostridiaceae bacterium]